MDEINKLKVSSKIIIIKEELGIFKDLSSAIKYFFDIDVDADNDEKCGDILFFRSGDEFQINIYRHNLPNSVPYCRKYSIKKYLDFKRKINPVLEIHKNIT